MKNNLEESLLTTAAVAYGSKKIYDKFKKDKEKALKEYDLKSDKSKFSAYTENSFKSTHVIKGRPKGWLIMDSVNNKSFPMDLFQIDNMNFNTNKLKNFFHQNYGGSKRDLFLPWHYTVELVEQTPFVIQTRPLLYKSRIPNFENHITIMIIGDANIDIYNNTYYKAIAHQIINPYKLLPGVKLSNDSHIFNYQIGSNFDFKKLYKELM